MALREDRCLFTKLLATKLIPKMIEDGYEVALDEVTEHITEKDPTSDHKKNSFHHQGLAADLNLYLSGVYQNKTEQHKAFGEHWESLHEKCTWGGRWKDGNHYSFGEKGKH